MAVDAVADTATWDGLPTLGERYTHQILDAEDAAGVKATFFVPIRGGRRRRCKRDVGLGATARKLARLLGEFRFDTCWNVLNAALGGRR